MKKAPKVLTRMRLSCYWGDNLDEKELNDVVNYINELEQQCKKQKEVIDRIKEYIQNHQLLFKDSTLEEIEEWFNQFYIDVLDILKEVSE